MAVRRFVKTFETPVPATVQQLWDFHASAEALKLLTPANRSLTPISTDLTVRNGALHVMQFRQFGLRMEWHARISDVSIPHGFTDTAEKSPFKYWSHRHDFLDSSEGSILRDTVTYSLPGGPFASLINWLFVKGDLEALFQFRHAATLKHFRTKSIA